MSSAGFVVSGVASGVADGSRDEGQPALFPEPEPHTRALVPVPAQDAARPVVDLVVAGELL